MLTYMNFTPMNTNGTSHIVKPPVTEIPAVQNKGTTAADYFAEIFGWQPWGDA